MLGNIFLLLAVLFSVSLLYLSSSPKPGGDYSVGYSFMLLFYSGGLSLFSGLLAWHLAVNQRLDWLSTNNWFLFLGWLAFVVALVAGASYKAGSHPEGYPVFLRWLALSRVHFWLPLLMFGSAYWLLNKVNAGETIPNFVQFSIKTGLAVSILMSLATVFGLYRSSSLEHSRAKEAGRIIDEQIQKIEELEPDGPIYNLLVFCRSKDYYVHQTATEKITSRPNWEAEFINLLNDSEWQSDVYQFISGFLVRRPELFVEPIKTALGRTATEIKYCIENASRQEDLDMESFAVEPILSAIDDTFSKVPGADFRTEIRAIRAALDAKKPERFKNVEIGLTRIVDEWLKLHP